MILSIEKFKIEHSTLKGEYETLCHSLDQYEKGEHQKCAIC